MFTLADSIYAARGKLIDKNHYRGGLTELSEAIGTAERFVFSQEASDACRALAVSKPSSLLEATKFCRIPFKRVWCEWPGRITGLPDRPDYWDKEHVTFVPNRVGCFCDCLDETHKRFGVVLVWEHSQATTRGTTKNLTTQQLLDVGPNIEMSALSFVVNWHDRWPIMDRHNILAGSSREINFRGGYEKYVGVEKEESAARTLAENVAPSLAPFCRGLYDKYNKSGSYLDMERLIKAANNDWEGELYAIIAKFCFLNAKNCAGLEPVTHDKLNKKRAKSGKPPLLSHSTVTINMSKKAEASARSAGATDAEIRQHIVRGHFKIRSGGVFWWRPFLRGDAAHGRVVRDGYKVAAPTPIPASQGMSPP